MNTMQAHFQETMIKLTSVMASHVNEILMSISREIGRNGDGLYMMRPTHGMTLF